jgi:ABC-type multidrug transport system fused ATPase/permease subunit
MARFSTKCHRTNIHLVVKVFFSSSMLMIVAMASSSSSSDGIAATKSHLNVRLSEQQQQLPPPPPPQDHNESNTYFHETEKISEVNALNDLEISKSTNIETRNWHIPGNTQTATEPYVDPLLERFQRIVGHKSIAQGDENAVIQSGNKPLSRTSNNLMSASEDSSTSEKCKIQHEDEGTKLDTKQDVEALISQHDSVAAHAHRNLHPPPPPPPPPPKLEQVSSSSHNDQHYAQQNEQLSHRDDTYSLPSNSAIQQPNYLSVTQQNQFFEHQSEFQSHGRSDQINEAVANMSRNTNQQILPQEQYQRSDQLGIQNSRPMIQNQQNRDSSVSRNAQLNRSYYQARRQQPRPIWKSLWSRVEKGLDSLASVEEKVSERTIHLTHQLSTKARGILTSKSHLPTSSHLAGASVKCEKEDPGQLEQIAPTGMMGGRKFVALSSKSNAEPMVLNARGSLPPVSTSQHPVNNDDISVKGENTDIWNAQALKTPPQSPWDSRSPLRAGGSEAITASERRISPFTQLYMDQGTSKTSESPTLSKRVTFESTREPKSIWSRVPLPSLPRLPSVVSKFLGRGSDSYRAMTDATMDAWKNEEFSSRRWTAVKRKKELTVHAAKVDSLFGGSMPPLTDLLLRCENGKSTTLLSPSEARKCRRIGFIKAILDTTSMFLVFFSVQEFLSLPDNLFQKAQISADTIVSVMAATTVQMSQGWGFYALTAAILTSVSNYVFLDHPVEALKASVGNTVRSASRYSQLYMRLVAGIPVENHVPNRMQLAAQAQVMQLIQLSRLHSFVTLILLTFALMSLSVVRPIIFAILGSLFQCFTIPELTSWPVPWSMVFTIWKEVIVSLGGTIKDLFELQFSSFVKSPVAFTFQISFFATLLAAAYLPTLASHEKVRTLVNDEIDNEDVTASAFGSVTTLSNLGVSSASRLALLSKSGALEGTLERWRATLPPPSAVRDMHSLRLFIKQIGCSMLVTLFLLTPILIYASCIGEICMTPQVISSHAITIWHVSIILLFVLHSSWNAIARITESSNLKPHVKSFAQCLSDVVKEVSGISKGNERALGTSISPTQGLRVTELWAAHTAKRAWAVRGANFECNNGEVVVILGDDGAGKSRLLTAISEAMINPAKRSLTTTKVRGNVTIGGLDSANWDRDQLKKRLGLFLNDVRTIADNAEFMSGFTLEEILEPMDGIQHQNPTAGARATKLALHITGLTTSLISQLPGKLSTVITANENDLMPSPLRPRCHALSPSEWSKLLLARVLAQAIFDNENISNAPLMGSVLLLDDLMMFLSEVEELKLLLALRKSGAATVFTSHKWATGRLADRIVVVKDGAVVESGSHAELLARGPQISVYAAKWHAMTTGGS